MKDENDIEIKIQIAKKLAKNKKYTVALETIKDILIRIASDTKPFHMREIAEAILDEKIPHNVFRGYYYRRIKPLIEKNEKAKIAKESEQKRDTINNEKEEAVKDEAEEYIEEYKDLIQDIKLARELEKKINKEDA